MREQGEHKTAGNDGCRCVNEREAQGQEQKRASKKRTKESERRGTRPTDQSKAQKRDRLKRDQQQDDVDETRIGENVHHASPVCWLL